MRLLRKGPSGRQVSGQVSGTTERPVESPGTKRKKRTNLLRKERIGSRRSRRHKVDVPSLIVHSYTKGKGDPEERGRGRNYGHHYDGDSGNLLSVDPFRPVRPSTRQVVAKLGESNR